MYIGRVAFSGPDGVEPRIVVAENTAGPWLDLRAAERLRLERRGAAVSAARRIALALVPGSTAAALEGGVAFFEAAHAALAAGDEEVTVAGSPTFLAPLDPTAYRDFMAFEDHFSFGYRWRGLPVPEVLYEFPVSYMGSVQGIIGPEEEVPWPHFCEHMDFELELGIVIGRSGRDIRPQDAHHYIAGFTILNDFSARDIQLKEMAAGLGPSKGKHFATAIGPWIAAAGQVTADNLRMRARINGEIWCDSSSSEIMWPVSEIVAWASASEHLAAGTLLGTGTANRGCGVELGRRLAPGDLVELDIEGLGVLRNRMGRPREGWTPVRRQRKDTDKNTLS
jgi:2-keto-4-pentenoate hydratase/2-oxohepta-3-ene-1,7-dioic acid hydratase in catechol pathway